MRYITQSRAAVRALRPFYRSRIMVEYKPVRGIHTEANEDEPWRTPHGVESYLESRVSNSEYAANPELARGLERAERENMPAIAITPMFGQFLAIMVKSIKAERVLEIGTLGGYSTYFLANALPATGQIDTIEYSEVHARVAQANFIELDVCPFPKTHVGKALDLLRDPNGAFAQPPGVKDGLPPDSCGYDLVFIDANKDQYLEYMLEALRLTRPGGILIFDNVVRRGLVAAPDGAKVDADAQGVRNVFDWIKKDNGKTVLASALQTVGDKSWDGFAVVYKK